MLFLQQSLFPTANAAKSPADLPPADLTIVSWGGAYEYSQTEAYFKLFTNHTGIRINIERYNGGIDELRQQVESGQSRWDLIDMGMADNLEACAHGLLQTIDHSMLLPAPDGTPAALDFIPGSLPPCGVAQVVSATVLAFDVRAFPGRKPSTVKDLFDLKNFPGRRALQKTPLANLEWALLSYGVPQQDVYNLLSTERGLRLAFKQLDKIRDHIVWWSDGAEPPQLLASAAVTMASGYNGRFFHATVAERQAIDVIWDGQLYEYSTWAIPRDAPNPDRARQFIQFATGTNPLAKQTEYISYGPARRSAEALIWRHAASGIDIRPHLPTYPPNLQNAIRKDHEWYARTQARLQLMFNRWLSE
jgi:putative spermidine/putrescine transport system substrate-binding protein